MQRKIYVFLLLCTLGFGQKPSIKASKGFHLQSRTPIFYESSIPITYTVEIPDNDYKGNKRRIDCSQGKHYCNFMHDVNELQNLVSSNLAKLNPFETNSKRTKRGLDFIASFEN